MAAAESRLASLTTAQTRALQSHREQWQRLATSAGPTDKAAAERALARLYTGAGLDLPEVRWFPSPIQMLKANASKSGVLAGDNVWHSIGGLLGDRVWRTLWRYVDAKLGHDVWQALDGSLWTKVTRSAGSNTLWTKAPYDGLPEPRERGAFGVIQHPGRVELLACQALEYEWGRTGEYFTEECWVSEMLPTFAFFQEVVGIGELNEIGPLIALATVAGPWVAREKAVLISERPTRFELDELGRLHSEDGPALAYPADVELFCWQGVSVPRDVIAFPEKLTVRKIRRQANVEVRRAMTERYGVERFIRDGGCELEDSDQYGKLWSAGHWGAGKWLELQNSTAEPDGSFKTYFLQVPPHSYSARGAVAWTFDLHEHEYVIETES